VLAVATVLTLLPGRGARVLVRVLILAVLGASIYGILDHIAVNANSGPLDARYADTWDSLPATTRWWHAVTKQVGPAPTLAPGVLAQTALLLFLAGLLRDRPTTDV
jgi:hypothetical protein